MDRSSVFGLIGILKIISSANLMRRVFFGLTAAMSVSHIKMTGRQFCQVGFENEL